MTEDVRAPMCLGCRHLRESDTELACDAFPAGIPVRIIESRHDHREPLKGDRGIRFEPIDKAAAEYAAELFPKGGDA